MRQRGQAVGFADVRIRERVLDRGDQIVHRAISGLDERGGDALRSGADVNRRRLQSQAALVRLAHQVVDRQQRRSLTVDRHFDLLAARRAAEQVAGRAAVQQHLEDVFAVGREDVHDRHAAARAHWRPRDVTHLRAVARQLVDRRGRGRRAIAYREAADRAGGAQVPFHHRRRQALLFGDVVEAVRNRVGWQVGVDVDLESEQLAHRGRVLGAIQALRGPRPGIRIERRRRIDPVLERFGHPGQDARLRTLGAGRRHHPRAQLANDFLGDDRMIDGLRRVERGQRQPTGLAAFAVTADAGTCLTIAVGASAPVRSTATGRCDGSGVAGGVGRAGARLGWLAAGAAGACERCA